MAAPDYFPPALTRHCIAKQNNWASPSYASLRPSAVLRLQVRPTRRRVIAIKAANGAPTQREDGFQREVDLGIDVGRADRDMAEPGPDGIDVYAGQYQVAGGRVPDDMRGYRFTSQFLHSCRATLDEPIDSEAGKRFGAAYDVLGAGEGIETMLSLRCALPRLPMVAALSANHLTALALPSGLRRVYIALDNDGAGRRAAEALSARAKPRASSRSPSRQRRTTLMPICVCLAASWPVRCKSSSRRRISSAFFGVEVRLFGSSAPSLSAQFVRSGPAGWPGGGLREGDRAGIGAPPQRLRGSSE
jgi:hypothetical protein